MNNTNLYNQNYPKEININLKITRFLHCSLAFIIIAWMSKGVFSYLIPPISGTIMFGLFFIWLFLALFTDVSYLYKTVKNILPLGIFYLYILISSSYNFSDTVNTYVNQIPYLIIISMIFIFYFEKDYPKFKKTIGKFLILDTVYISINTYVKLQEIPNLSRILATADSAERLSSINTSALGGYDFMYSLTPIIVFLGYILIKSRIHKINKIIIFLYLLFLISLLIKSSYTTAILLSLLFLALLYLHSFSKKKISMYIFILSIIILYPLLYNGIVSDLLLNLANFDGLSETIRERLQDLSLFTSPSSQVGRSLSERFRVYEQSINVILNSNIFVGLSLSRNSIYKVGGHASWLDLIGQYGVVSFFFFFYLNNIRYFIIKNLNPKLKGIVNIYWLYFIILGFVNTLLFGRIFLVWIFMIPWLLQILEKYFD